MDHVAPEIFRDFFVDSDIAKYREFFIMGHDEYQDAVPSRSFCHADFPEYLLGMSIDRSADLVFQMHADLTGGVLFRLPDRGQDPFFRLARKKEQRIVYSHTVTNPPKRRRHRIRRPRRGIRRCSRHGRESLFPAGCRNRRHDARCGWTGTG